MRREEAARLHGPFEGKHFQLAETICVPEPIRRPRPPILIGGNGERKTLRLVAKYADACNIFANSPDVVAHKLAVLDGHCQAEGRDPSTIERTIPFMGNVFADTDSFLNEDGRVRSHGHHDRGSDADGRSGGLLTEVCETLVPRLAEL